MSMISEPAAEPIGLSRAFDVFRVGPQLLASGKSSTWLAKTDLARCVVMVVARGGETNLHAHQGTDEIWLVLQGKAAFYTTDDQVIATLGRYEGLLIPRKTPYWFDSASDDENLVILRFGAVAQDEVEQRVDYGPRRSARPGENGSSSREAEPLKGKFFG